MSAISKEIEQAVIDAELLEECDACGKPQPTAFVLEQEPERRIVQCSICERWLCTSPCFSQHSMPKHRAGNAPTTSWWKRVIRRGH
jgi:hypothetical protein